MPRYLTLHTLACLTRQGAGQLSERIFSSSRAAGTPRPRSRAPRSSWRAGIPTP